MAWALDVDGCFSLSKRLCLSTNFRNNRVNLMRHKFFNRLVLTVLVCSTQFLSAAPQPIAPVGKDGQPLNLDFETGTLKDWSLDGKAFSQQPIRGDAVAARNGPGGVSAHQGEFWIGGYEMLGDEVTGKLTSVSFKVTQPWASFLVSGGDGTGNRVELADASSGKVFFKVSGENLETLRPVVIDLKERVCQEIFIRVVDEQKGGWGHINFDNFKFYAERPSFPNEIDAKKQASVPEADKVLYEGLSPEDAVAKMTLPPGFKATLFAGEPDVKQPIAFAIDDRGRLFVAEAYTYPIRVGTAPQSAADLQSAEANGKESADKISAAQPTPEQLKDIYGGHDRVICFEDTNGDGKFDKRTVVAENLNLVSAIELGFGGMYIGAAPYMLFFPIENWDEPKAGTPQILLDGWAYQDTHETLNTFTWGPDGWLYGCQGVFTHSNVGKPGAPDSERTHINAGVWRYHPTKKIFEIFAEGTSNPWGIDFDEHGQLFAEACVIPHLFHLVQGGRFTRQAGSHFNPYVYDDIKTIADHVHYAGNKGPHAGNGRSDSAGGGHAHAGLMIYQGDNWPAEYRGKIFIGNIHGQRINEDVPERQGSGFVGHHAPDPINFNDKWSQVINFQTGPDGAVYFIDWYDKNQCHHNDPNGHDRSNGRIFKISYREKKFGKVDLQEIRATDLVELQRTGNVWAARHARRILQERSRSEEREAHLKSVGEAVGDTSKSKTEREQLRLLWTMHTTGKLPENLLTDSGKLSGNSQFIRSPYEYVRAWAIQIYCEDRETTEDMLKEFVRLAREDKSPVVRLYLASALQRLPVEQRWEILDGLYTHSEDAEDHNLPLMVWYAAEPLPTVDAKRALQMAETAKLPNILNFTVRRTAALGTPEAMAAIVDCLQSAADLQSAGHAKTDSPSANSNSSSADNMSAARCLDILNGLSTALTGQRSAPMPKGWEEVEKQLSDSPNAEIRAKVQSLSLTFGSSGALASLKKTLMDDKAEATARRTALDSLLAAKDKDLAPLLQQLLDHPLLRSAAMKGLASYDDPQTADKILAIYPSLSTTEKRDALNTLASRVAFAKPLLAAVAGEKVSRKDLSADLVRQLRNLKNDELNAQIEKVWGAMRETAADKQPLIEKFKKIYHAGGSQPGEASRGRAVFAKTCAQCHTLFDTGGKVGPDLTGSNRADLDYILQNILDPNAVIPNDYRASTLETKDDRVITGVVKSQDDKSVTILTPNETLTIPRNEIASLKQNELSMMPEGLLEPLSEQEFRDLIYYLSRPGQVPLPGGGQ
jgi:putative membrane-bound dehydrogenase-like protein